MTKEITLRLTPQQASDTKYYLDIVANKLKVKKTEITEMRVRKRSIDARGRKVMIQLIVDVYIGEKAPSADLFNLEYKNVSLKEPVIVVGSGPGGLFAALHLIELGLCPIVIERGKDASTRKRDLALLNKNNPVNPESNYAFGEGGAGTYSDGKLYTRSTKRGDFRKIINVFRYHGASEQIAVDAHPHIGTNVLPRIIKNMRKTIIESGGQVLFNTKVTKLLVNDGQITGVEINNVENIKAKAVILATGHSAHDVYYMLHNQGIELEAKTWAMGVRVEHPQGLIDEIQYHSPEGRGKYLPAASYSFSCQVKQRGVYSFCMCPGGFIVPAMTGPEQMVVNGMSPSRRNSPYANSGMVVEIRPEDLPEEFKGKGVMAGLEYQKEIERLCYINGGQNIIAPAQRLTDFVGGRLSFDLPKVSYVPGAIAAPLHFVLPEMISSRLQEGFKNFGKWAKGFLDYDAVILGTESRTSSPLRIPRDSFSLMHPQVKGLFPCGEGAGYSGGIASSAIDGERCAQAAYNLINN